MSHKRRFKKKWSFHVTKPKDFDNFFRFGRSFPTIKLEGPPSKNLNICFEEWTWTVPDLPLLTIHPGFSSTAAFCIIIPVLFQHFKVLGYKRFKECKWLSADKNTQLEKYWKYKTVQCTTASFFTSVYFSFLCCQLRRELLKLRCATLNTKANFVIFNQKIIAQESLSE